MNLQKSLVEKHIHGQKKYHAFSFIADGRVMKEETIDELIDGINYLVYQIIISRHDKREILRWTEDELNIVYSKIISEVDSMDTESDLYTERNIAKMRDMIKDLKKLNENLQYSPLRLY